MSWTLVFTRHAQQEAPKLASAGLKAKAQELLALIEENPFQNPPPYEKLVGDLSGYLLAKNQYSAPSGLRGAV